MKRQSTPIIGIILAILTLTMLVSALSATVGFVVVSNSSTRTGAFVQAFAAGALLTMIADEMAPEAFSRAHIAKGIATTLGFILAVLLTSLE